MPNPDRTRGGAGDVCIQW